ncbi:hypothetical protein D3C87_1709290 [compost metagenome]
MMVEKLGLNNLIMMKIMIEKRNLTMEWNLIRNWGILILSQASIYLEIQTGEVFLKD